MARPIEKRATQRKTTRAERIVGEVRNFIYDNRLRPGDRLPAECDLARQLKVSRSTLREALKGLTVNGLLESRPRSGTRVRRFSYEQVAEALVAHFYLSDLTLREVLEARAALELAALPYVLKRISPDQIETLRDIEARFERAARHDSTHLDQDLKLDLMLHEALLSFSGNRLLASMVGLLRAFFSHAHLEEMILRRHVDRSEVARTINEHRLIIEGLAARDSDLVGRVLHEHFDRQLRWLNEEEAAAGQPAVRPAESEA